MKVGFFYFGLNITPIVGLNGFHNIPFIDFNEILPSNLYFIFGLTPLFNFLFNFDFV